MPRVRGKTNTITQVDVAAEAGVSAITVSRVMRTPDLVSDKARQKVQAAIEKLGYVPDPAASALASLRTDIVALLVPSLTNNVFSDVLRGIYDSVEDTPYSIQIGNYSYSPSSEEHLIRTFLRQKPAGIIVAGIDQTAEARDLLKNASCPVVQIMDLEETPIDLAVGFSHEVGTRAAVEHLLDCGYRNVGFLGARMDPRSQKRMSEFILCTKEHGVFDPKRVVTTPKRSSVGIGAQLFADILAKAPETDAVFCNNDDLAAGALFEAERRNIAIPDKMGICGFNDLEMSRHLNPSLTSISTPRYEIGQTAFRLLIDALEDIRPDAPMIDLSTTLVLRNSTGPTAQRP